MSEIEAVIERCKTLATLPEGYTMKADNRTHNILVKGPNLGFCISEKAMKEGYYLELFAPTLDALIKAEADYLKDPTNTCWHLPPLLLSAGDTHDA